jgi:quercetin dioxygenase-like cupin family protein
MKNLLTLSISLFLVSSFAQAQYCVFPEYKCENGHNLVSALPDGDFGNIKVEKLAHDSLSTGFMIWVKKNVRAHRHVHHSENIYVIEGEGDMTVGEKTFRITPGSYIFVPTNVVHSVVVDESKGTMKVLSVQAPFFDGNDRVFVD